MENNLCGKDTEGRSMSQYKKEYVETFLRDQEQLFPKRILETTEEAVEFLEDCMAIVLPDIRTVREYLDENGMDTVGMSDQELKEAAEVFAMPDGKFLIVEG